MRYDRTPTLQDVIRAARRLPEPDRARIIVAPQGEPATLEFLTYLFDSIPPPNGNITGTVR